MNPATLLNCARARCSREHRTAANLCPLCFEIEVIGMLVEQNPKLCRDDAMKLVWEWILSADRQAPDRPNEWRRTGSLMELQRVG